MRPTLPVLALLLAGCAAPAPRPEWAAEAWPAADRLFRLDPRWQGGDAAYSLALGGGRTLWLFGDSFVDPRGRGDRRLCRLVRNSVGLMEGDDPSRSRMTFYWGGTQRAERGQPAEAEAGDFFPAPEGEWRWPGQGVRVGDRLLLFLMRVRKSGEGAFGFETFGWTAALVENPKDPPDRWRMSPVKVPPAGTATPGSAGALVWEGRLYAYAPDGPEHRVLLVRWPLSDARLGDLSRPEWWTGGGWGPLGKAAPAFLDGQVEGSVHRDPVAGDFVQVQSSTLGDPGLELRRALEPEGPWTEPRKLFRPPEGARPGVLVYAGKAHPWLWGSALAMTYATNTADFGALAGDPTLYFPRFVRLVSP